MWTSWVDYCFRGNLVAACLFGGSRGGMEMFFWSVLNSAEIYLYWIYLLKISWFGWTFVALKFVVSVQAPRTRAVKNVRRHACSSIIKMCRDYPQLVLVCKCSCCEVSCLSFSWILWDLQPPWLQSLLSSQETFLLHKQQSGSFPVPLFFPAEKISAWGIEL